MAMKNISKFIETKDNKHSRIHGKKYFKKSIKNSKGSERLLKVHKGTDRFQSDYVLWK